MYAQASNLIIFLAPPLLYIPGFKAPETSFGYRPPNVFSLADAVTTSRATRLLALQHRLACMVAKHGFEPQSSDYKSPALPLSYSAVMPRYYRHGAKAVKEVKREEKEEHHHLW